MGSLEFEEIKKIIELQFGRLEVKASDRFAEDLAAESADVINLVAAVEDRFGITLKESEIARLSTPQDLFELVQARLRES